MVAATLSFPRSSARDESTISKGWWFCARRTPPSTTAPSSETSAALSRILRRAARHGVLLGLERPFLYQVADAVIDEMSGAYPELNERRAYIAGRIQRDEERFLETLS